MSLRDLTQRARGRADDAADALFTQARALDALLRRAGFTPTALTFTAAIPPTLGMIIGCEHASLDSLRALRSRPGVTRTQRTALAAVDRALTMSTPAAERNGYAIAEIELEMGLRTSVKVHLRPREPSPRRIASSGDEA